MHINWRMLRKLIGYYPRMFKLIWEASPGYTFLALTIAIISAFARPAQIWMTKLIIDQVIAALQAFSRNESFDGRAVITLLAIIILVEALVAIFQILSETFRDVLSQVAGSYTDYVLLKKAAQMDIAFYETPAFYDQMENARRDSWKARNIVWFGVDFIVAFVSLTTILILLYRLHPLAVVILLCAVIPQGLVRSYFARQQFQVWTQRAPEQRMVQYLGHLLSSRDPVKEIRLFGLDPIFLTRHRHNMQLLTNQLKHIKLTEAWLIALLSFLSLIGSAAIWVYAVIEAIVGRITIGDVALAFQTVEQVRAGLGNLFWLGGALFEASLFASNFFGFLDLQPNAVEGALKPLAHNGQTPRRVQRPFQHGIEFRNVSFHYPGSQRMILQNLSFKLAVGETIALVGENGAGKTTLVKLLARYYDPTAGTILLDGHDLRDYDLDDLRRNIGVIFQDFVRYHLSARENIGFGQVEHVEDPVRVTKAALQGGAQPIVEKLPKQFETFLGRTFEHSVDLSGGEWQKLALSRAFMREAQVLILDEPTASLDALAEYEVYQRFADLTTGKTTVFISHRFSTVRMAQHILVLENGQLIEEGTHESLLKLNGKYAQMFNTQAQQYR